MKEIFKTIEAFCASTIDTLLLTENYDNTCGEVVDLVHDFRVKVRTLQLQEMPVIEGTTMREIIVEFLSDFATESILDVPGIYDLCVGLLYYEAIDEYQRRYNGDEQYAKADHG